MSCFAVNKNNPAAATMPDPTRRFFLAMTPQTRIPRFKDHITAGIITR
jgi:hypothetical protein